MRPPSEEPALREATLRGIQRVDAPVYVSGATIRKDGIVRQDRAFKSDFEQEVKRIGAKHPARRKKVSR